ncbi:MAG: hypothetical protein JNL28_10595 [Planctomycetes bacterium]|nr:hypothetical protein [Planctomycetota bacterium]
MKFTYSKTADSKHEERGAALIPALMVVSMLAMLGLSMLSAGLSGSRVVTGQSDEFRLTSAVESVGALTADHLWSGYLRSQGGAAGTIATFRAYLTTVGITNGGAHAAHGALDGTDMLHAVPLAGAGGGEFDEVDVDQLRVVRQDDADATRLFVTVSATTKRGKLLVSKPLSRAVQLVYTVKPAPFEGFDYGILTKNVNCVFCHTVVDSADRYYNQDPSKYGTFDKVKVGTLESLMLRINLRGGIGDWEADSTIAGSLYVRGHATNQNGLPLTNWGNPLSMHSSSFDAYGNIIQDGYGAMTSVAFSPAGTPPQPGENLYLNYPTNYADMTDGKLPESFPPPFPDDGGIDPTSGALTPAGAGNKRVDPNEFYAATQTAEGTISGGVLTLVNGSQPITTATGVTQALQTGNITSLPSVTNGNLVLTGTADNPIRINGTVAIDGDVVINGYVQGTGVLLVSGNIYVPTNLQYLDGRSYLDGDAPGSPTGPITFGVAQDGTQNALGLACGGNMMLGDYLAPSGSVSAEQNAIVTGGVGGGFNFSLAEISLFNRTEWAHTQQYLPGPGQDKLDPSTWTVVNPSYIANYVPRYYHFGPGDEIPIYNLGNLYFDPTTGTWHGDAEVPLSWDTTKLTLLDPNDLSNPALYDPVTGAPRATVLSLAPDGDWISEQMLETLIENLSVNHVYGTPMQIDGLLYTNNAIFGVVPRAGPMKGQMVVNGSLVCADLGLLVPGYHSPSTAGTSKNVVNSPFAVGLRLNYDKRTKTMLNVTNPYSVTISRTLWNPIANVQ